MKRHSIFMKVVQVLKDGSMDETDLPELSTQLSKRLVKCSKSQGSCSFKELYEWVYGETIVRCYGWYDGDAGFENKHDLPPGGKSRFLDEDSSVQLLFGDLFMVRFRGTAILDFDISEYGEFYNLLFGGFDDCSDTSSTEEEPDYMSEDGDYIPLSGGDEGEEDGGDEGEEEEEDEGSIGSSEVDEDSELEEDSTDY